MSRKDISCRPGVILMTVLKKTTTEVIAED